MGREQKTGCSTTVITPVFNGEPYLRNCIKSVLAQTQDDFEYIIADNRSTDDSLRIARSYADTDSRVHVVEADEHVGPVQNWNRSLGYVQEGVRYIKFVHADDWIYPECLERMVGLAEADERVAIVSAYRLEEDKVSLDRLPKASSSDRRERELVLEGRDVGRAIFLEHASVLGSPTSHLLRVSAMHEDRPFFDEALLHADKEACIRLLARHRFGFIREVLTFTRRHNESVTSVTNLLDSRRQDDLQILVRHGQTFLSASEMNDVMQKTQRLYYAFLARSLFMGRGEAFWKSHRKNFKKAGLTYRRGKLISAFLRQMLDARAMFNRFRSNRVRGDRDVATSASNFLAANRRAGESDS